MAKPKLMVKQVRETIRKYRLLNKNDRVVIGVSGGPDSVALLYILKSMSKELNLALHIAHLDHMLRKDSRKDREFVVRLARRMNLPVSTLRTDIKQLRQKGSIEEIARNARLEFLFGVAKKTKADKIALGHNLDDQAETVLMRILRGSGLYGLSGILPKREINGYRIIRPLIETRRREIEAFLKKRGIRPRIDASNAQDIYFRNRVRNKLLPLLEKEYNRNIKEILCNMAQNIGCDYDYLLRKANSAARMLGRSIRLDKFAKLHPAIQRLVLRAKIVHLAGDTRRVTFQHIKEIEDLVLNRPVNSVVDLPKGISVVKKKACLVFYKR